MNEKPHHFRPVIIFTETTVVVMCNQWKLSESLLLSSFSSTMIPKEGKLKNGNGGQVIHCVG